LVRGSLSVSGKVAWQGARHCGIRFDTDVVVEEWVRRVEHSGQRHVDEIIAAIRRPVSRAEAAPPRMGKADSLAAISTDLAAVCESLAGIPDLVAKYPGELLRIDAIAQRLASL